MEKSNPMDLIYSLVKYPSETEWIEFKDSNNEAERIGKDIAALANAAAYHGRDYAYKVWGVEDETRHILGTSFDYLKAKAKGNQSLSIWLRSMLSRNANYEFDQFDDNGMHFVVLKIRAATEQPVCFSQAAYIREGSSTTKLAVGSAKEAELWRRLQSSRFEYQAVETGLTAEDVRELLNVEEYFNLLSIKQPTSIEPAIVAFCEQGLVSKQDDDGYAITNLGALLIAKKLSAFKGLQKRVLRTIRFEGKGNFEILDDRFFDEGYATALRKAEDYVMTVTPAREVVEGAFRKVRRSYPQRAVRELLVNAVVHQDMAIATSGPLVGIYDNRIEFNNPGASLIPVDRVLNAQPKTRNNGLVGLLRQMDLCEEGGSGWDLAVAACESAHMLSPRMTSSEELGTKVTLFAGGSYDRMTKKERSDALYWHACLMYAQGESMSNQTLRERFGLSDEQKNTLAISRLIRECCDKGLVKEEDEDAGRRFKRYIPAWA